MSRFDAEPILEPLKDFQRATVEHVTERLYRSPQPSRRFLVADETGLGKSLVARGVIARAIEHLQDDDTVDRIDIVYVCSNSDIADQNLKRLNVTGQDHLPFASRLTLLAKHSRRLAAVAGIVGARQGGEPGVLHPRDLLRDGLADGQGGGTGDAAPPARVGTRPERAGREIQPHAAAGQCTKTEQFHLVGTTTES